MFDFCFFCMFLLRLNCNTKTRTTKLGVCKILLIYYFAQSTLTYHLRNISFHRMLIFLRYFLPKNHNINKFLTDQMEFRSSGVRYFNPRQI